MLLFDPFNSDGELVDFRLHELLVENSHILEIVLQYYYCYCSTLGTLLLPILLTVAYLVPNKNTDVRTDTASYLFPLRTQHG